MNFRKILVEIFYGALESVRPRTLMRKAIRVEKEAILISGRRYRLHANGGLYVFGRGKASVGMAKEVSRVLQGRVSGCFEGNRKGLTFLSAGSDGSDGNAAAAAVVDSRGYEKAMCLHLRIDDCLRNNNSNTFFIQTGGLIRTGPTGTNGMDISILYIGEEK